MRERSGAVCERVHRFREAEWRRLILADRMFIDLGVDSRQVRAAAYISVMPGPLCSLGHTRGSAPAS